MRVRWVLRYKESGKPKARLVIIGYHDPRVGSDVQTEAPVASRREEVCFSWQPLTISSPLKRRTSRTRSCKVRLTTTLSNGELAAEPVPELRKALICAKTKSLFSQKRATA